MIHLTMGPARVVAPQCDELGRTQMGFSAQMSQQEIYEANRGCWTFGVRAYAERYALLSFAGTVRQAIAIDRILPVGARAAIQGSILGPGDRVFDAYIGRPSPVPRQSNPVAYFRSTLGPQPCGCGCGGPVTEGDFLPGHDQLAVQERVARVGSVAEFLRWFDTHHTPTSGP
jgi:hypothetical protein